MEKGYGKNKVIMIRKMYDLELSKGIERLL